MIGTERKDNLRNEITFNGKRSTKEIEIAKRFNDFFINSIEEIVTNEDKVINTESEIYIEKDIQLRYFKAAIPEDYQKIIKNFKNKKGTEEGITTKIKTGMGKYRRENYDYNK